MRQLILACLLSLLILATGTAAGQIPIPTPAAPSVGAAAHVLMDARSGQVLAEGNADAARDPASLVKMMTAYVVFNELREGNIDLEELVTVSERAWRTPGSRMFIEPGDNVRVGDLIRGVIIQSGNDACVALAEHIAGDEQTFAQVMNSYAEQLGMENTYFANATGLPDEAMKTTARDTAILARAIVRDFPEYYGWYSERSFTWNDIRQSNRNRLLWRDSSVDGLKTGHTSAAGYNLAASAEREDMRLISVVLGTASEQARADQTQSLLNYGFRFFETHRLYDENEELTRTRVWKGDMEELGVGIAGDLHLTIPRRQYDNLEARLRLDEPLIAPIEAGQPVGRLVIRLQGEVMHEEPLLARENVAEGSLWRRLVDDVLLRFQ